MTELEQIAEQRKEAQEMIEMRELLEKLEKNRAFDKVINKGFFEETSKQMALGYACPMYNEDQLASVKNNLTGISVLANYFKTIHAKAMHAEQMLADLDELELEVMQGE